MSLIKETPSGNNFSPKAKLHVIEGGKSLSQKKKTPLPERTSQSSVRNKSLSPNGEIETNDKYVMEETKRYVEQFREALVSKTQLYKALRSLWGKECFEGTRHCWENMKGRANRGYASLSNDFDEFADFIHFMGPRPDKNSSIHRQDNSLGYSPQNCIWADKKTQSRERRNTAYLKYDNETRPLTEWAEKLGLEPSLLHSRRAKGWSDDEIINGRKHGRNSPWPMNMNDFFEKRFRSSGGRTYIHKLELYRKVSYEVMQEYLSHLEESWTPSFEGDEPSPDEQQQIEKWNKQYQGACEHYQLATQELQRKKALHSGQLPPILSWLQSKSLQGESGEQE